MKTWMHTVFLSVALMSLAACGAVAQGGDAASASFSVKTINGHVFSLAAHRGRSVVLYFFASWCGSCVAGAQELAQLHARDPKVAILALDVDPSDTPAMVAQFRHLIPDATYHFAIDTGDRVTKAYGIKALDESVVIGPTGVPAFHNTTSPSLQTLLQEVQKADQA